MVTNAYPNEATTVFSTAYGGRIMKTKQFCLLLLVVIAIALLAACGAPATAPTATPIPPTATPVLPTATAVPPTDTPTPETPAEVSLPVEVTEGLVFAKDTVVKKPLDRKLDLYAPADSGDWPILLFLPGSGHPRSAQSRLAQAIAERGVMVFVIDYPSPDPNFLILRRGKGYRQIAETVACALHFARATASDSGNETPFVALSGFSLGSGAVAHNALAGESVEQIWEAFSAPSGEPPSQVECTVGEGSTHVDALIGIAGAYDAFVGYGDSHYGKDFMQKHDPALWELLFGTLGENTNLKVRLLHSEADGTISYETSVHFNDLLLDF